MSLGKLKEGLRVVLGGDLSTLLSYVRNDLVGARLNARYEYKRERETTVPNWLDAETKVVWLGRYDGVTTSGHEYIRVLDGNYSIPIEIDPADPIESIEFRLVDAGLVESVSATAEFTLTDGSQTTAEFTYDSGRRNVALETIPVHLDASAPATAATVRVDVSTRSRSIRELIWDAIAPPSFRTDGQPWMEVPLVRPAEQPGPPVLLLSIDSLRYDSLECFEPLFEVLSDDAVVPAEPRIQGNWTPTSMASLVTGRYPGEHQYLPTVEAWGDTSQIDPDAETLTTLLADQGYKCSAFLGVKRLHFGSGFERGCHRFVNARREDTSAPDRTDDAREVVNALIEWIDYDTNLGWRSLCYFVHLWDPHGPYVPPFSYSSTIDARPADALKPPDEPVGYMEWLEDGLELDPALVETLHDQYRASVRYAAEQIARLVEHSKRVGLYEDAVILVTSDHGQEFLERGFRTHGSLYDAAIRPATIIKPPKSSDWGVPDTVDHVDFLPTISRELGLQPPAGVHGVPLQEKTGQDVRITERFSDLYYNLAVEVGGYKAIFTFEGGTRPTPEEFRAGPHNVEYYSIEHVRDGDFADVRDELSSDVKDDLFAAAERFVSTSEPKFAEMKAETPVK